MFTYLGTVRAGGVFLPLNTTYIPPGVDYFLGDAEPRSTPKALSSEVGSGSPEENA